VRRPRGSARRPELFDAAPPVIAVDQAIDLEAFAAELESLGYVVDERVDEPGEIACRGSVIDVYPPMPASLIGSKRRTAASSHPAL
jgi:transcription-repair coupling factor (superfamily II helicase)